MKPEANQSEAQVILNTPSTTRRKLATIDVYVDSANEDTCSSGAIARGHYVVFMNRGSGEHRIENIEQFRTVLAHELGHNLSLITRHPSHLPMRLMGWQATGDNSFILPAERQAWEMAHLIYPTIDRRSLEHGLHTYETAPAPSPERAALAALGKLALSIADEKVSNPTWMPWDNCPDCGTLHNALIPTLPEPTEDDFGRWEDDGGLPQLGNALANSDADAIYREVYAPAPQDEPTGAFATFMESWAKRIPTYSTQADANFYETHRDNPAYFDAPACIGTYCRGTQDDDAAPAPAPAPDEDAPLPERTLTKWYGVIVLIMLLSLVGIAATLTEFQALGLIQ